MPQVHDSRKTHKVTVTAAELAEFLGLQENPMYVVVDYDYRTVDGEQAFSLTVTMPTKVYADA